MIQSELNYYEKLVKKTIATLRLTAIICTWSVYFWIKPVVLFGMQKSSQEVYVNRKLIPRPWITIPWPIET